MTRRPRTLLASSVLAASLLLAACGSGDGAPAGDAPPSSPATAGETTVAPEGISGSDQMADVEFEDQSGAGDSAVVESVSSPQGGFVVLTAGEGGDVVGSVRLQVGTTSEVEVPLDPALTATTDLVATLYADTDGDGTFSAGTDQPVPAPIDGGDSEDDVSDQSDVVTDGATYTVG